MGRRCDARPLDSSIHADVRRRIANVHRPVTFWRIGRGSLVAIVELGGVEWSGVELLVGLPPAVPGPIGGCYVVHCMVLVFDRWIGWLDGWGGERLLFECWTLFHVASGLSLYICEVVALKYIYFGGEAKELRIQSSD